MFTYIFKISDFTTKQSSEVSGRKKVETQTGSAAETLDVDVLCSLSECDVVFLVRWRTPVTSWSVFTPT